MDQVAIQGRLKSLEEVLAGLEKEAKNAITFAVDSIARQQIEEVRKRIADA